MAPPRVRHPKAQKLTIRMTTDEYDALCRVGRACDLTLSALVRVWVRRALLSDSSSARPDARYHRQRIERQVAPPA